MVDEQFEQFQDKGLVTDLHPGCGDQPLWMWDREEL